MLGMRMAARRCGYGMLREEIWMGSYIYFDGLSQHYSNEIISADITNRIFKNNTQIVDDMLMTDCVRQHACQRKKLPSRIPNYLNGEVINTP
jgi:hypothetical protein